MTQAALATTFLPRQPLPGWLPEDVRRRLAGRTVAFDVPRAVRQRLRSPEKMRVSEWAAEYRIVAEGAHQGPWRHEYAPHTVKIMDTFGMPWVREVWFRGVEQSGKTNTMINCMGWAIDCDPGNIFYLMPTEHDSAKVIGGKIKPTLQQSPRLARYLSRKSDDTTMARINLTHGVTILPAWANSPSSMATWAAKHCFGDEVDKYPAMAGREADPITLLKKRNRNYRGRYKRFFGSTPAGMFISKGLESCHQVWEWRVRCPDCGELVRMAADHLVLPEGATPESVEIGGCEYACTCGSLWDDRAREAAIRGGQWVCVKGAEMARPAKVGFHHRAWECLDVPLEEIAAAWLRAKSGDHAAQVAWANGYEAEDYREALSVRKEDEILKLRDDRLEGQLPAVPIAAITMAADMQKRGFWYKITAWGYGLEQESWTLKTGFVDTWEALRRLFFESEFTAADGTRHTITYRGMDSGGGEGDSEDLTRTAEAYLFAARNPGVFLFKGRQPMTTRYRETDRDTIPGTKKPLPGRVRLYLLNTTHYKDRLAAKLMINPADPGAWHLHAEADEDLARQMCAEGKDSQGVWRNENNKPNHLWDCSYYELALVDIANVKLFRPPDPPPAEKPQAVQAPPPPPPTRGPGSLASRMIERTRDRRNR